GRGSAPGEPGGARRRIASLDVPRRFWPAPSRQSCRKISSLGAYSKGAEGKKRMELGVMACYCTQNNISQNKFLFFIPPRNVWFMELCLLHANCQGGPLARLLALSPDFAAR